MNVYSMFSKLCEYCVSTLNTNDTSYHLHHTSVENLASSAERGCALCSVLYDSLYHTSWPLKAASERSAANFKYYVSDDTTRGRQSFPTIYFFAEFADKPNPPKGRLEVCVEILITPAQITPGSNVVRQLPSFTNTGDDEAWKVATQWLEKCTDTHPFCLLSPEAQRLPTRLLDVGSYANPSLHLHETGSELSTEQYLTLSHCWGHPDRINLDNTVRLTASSIDSMQTSIDFFALPKTFQDAITITRRLSIRYLWIDSLCIIQNSVPDWEHESSLMGSVYENGYCNIAATAAADGRVGCFLQRNPLLAQPCRIRLERNLSKFGLRRGVYDLVSSRMWEEGLTEQPLLRRAWVVQERLLSRRVLHFGRNQLFWECKELDACEMYPNVGPPALARPAKVGSSIGGERHGFKSLEFKNINAAAVRTEIQLHKEPWTISFAPALPSGDSVDHYYLWNKMLSVYTRCGITEETDKLIAISAIAKLVHAIAKDVYLAGMWKRHLPYQLIWVVDQRVGDVQIRRRTKEYVAPSWSWASMSGPVEPYLFIRPDNPVNIQILSVSVTCATSDKFGQVLAGHITIRGWLRKFRITLPPEEGTYGALTVSHVAQFDEVPVRGEHHVWFLPVVSLGPWIMFESLGLLLQGTDRDGEFRRVGRYRAGDDPAKKYFRLPPYPLETEGDEPVRPESSANKTEKRGWFGTKRKLDDMKDWTERVITII